MSSASLVATYTLYIEGGVSVTHSYTLPMTTGHARELVEGVTRMVMRALAGKPTLVYLEHPVGAYRSDRILGYSVRVFGEGPGESLAAQLEEHLSFLRA